MPNFPDSLDIEGWQMIKVIDNRMARDLLAQGQLSVCLFGTRVVYPL
jgi:hypothetical protein